MLNAIKEMASEKDISSKTLDGFAPTKEPWQTPQLRAIDLKSLPANIREEFERQLGELKR